MECEISLPPNPYAELHIEAARESSYGSMPFGKRRPPTHAQGRVMGPCSYSAPFAKTQLKDFLRTPGPVPDSHTARRQRTQANRGTALSITRPFPAIAHPGTAARTHFRRSPATTRGNRGNPGHHRPMTVARGR